MKKILIILLSLFLLVGCMNSSDTPKKATETFFMKYNNLDDTVLNDLDSKMQIAGVSEEYKDEYKEAYKRQFKDLKYEIIDETITGDTAVEKVKIKVYDYYKSQNDAKNYSTTTQDEFLTDGTFDNDKYTKYVIDQMKKEDTIVEYTIAINLEKVDDKWQVTNLDDDDLEKIHGTYTY